MSLEQAVQRLQEGLRRLDTASLLAEQRAIESRHDKEMSLESLRNRCESLKNAHEQALQGLDALSARLHNLLDS